jgi:hypothetical protein
LLGSESVTDQAVMRPRCTIMKGSEVPLSLTWIAVVREITAHGAAGQLGGFTVPVLAIWTTLARASGASVAASVAATHAP